MNKLSFTCPQCGQNFIDIEGVEPNQKVECGQCHFQFNVPSEGENISDNTNINMQVFSAVEQKIEKEHLDAKCPKCGKDILPNAQFCGYCGESLRNKEENQPHISKIDEDLSNKGNRLFANALGVEKLEGFSFSKFFVQTFKHHSWDEMEEIVAVGTKSTTPKLSSVSTEWPTPWFFFRVILFVILAYLIVIWRSNDLGPYALMIRLLLGIIGMPLAALSFFFEINILKNISAMQVGKLIFVGGFISILATLLVGRVIEYESAIWAGPIEEIVKGGVMLLFIRNPRYRYKLNGLLVGASVGVGFAIIETAGYVVRSNDFEFTMFIRAFVAPLCHVLYSSLVGYALWEARANGFTLVTLLKGKTLRLIALAIILHMFWNSRILVNEMIIKCIIVAFIGYSSVIYLLQDCMNEIRLLKEKL